MLEDGTGRGNVREGGMGGRNETGGSGRGDVEARLFVDTVGSDHGRLTGIGRGPY